MSLILRSMCQPVLDNHNLHSFHTGINDHHNLVVTTECGKPLFTLNGITFSRKSPYKPECVIAKDLLEEFLNKHSTLINNYLDSKADFNELKKEHEAAFTKIKEYLKNKAPDNLVFRFTKENSTYRCTIMDSFHAIFIEKGPHSSLKIEFLKSEGRPYKRKNVLDLNSLDLNNTFNKFKPVIKIIESKEFDNLIKKLSKLIDKMHHLRDRVATLNERISTCDI